MILVRSPWSPTVCRLRRKSLPDLGLSRHGLWVRWRFFAQEKGSKFSWTQWRSCEANGWRFDCAIGSFAEPSYGRALRQRVKRLGLESVVDWIGFHSDANAQLQQLDLFVLPSLFGEGLPMVVLESMAMGVPVVATDVEGVPEAIRDRREGRIVPAGDPAALAQAIADIIRGSCCWTTLRRNAMTRQAAHFSDIGMAQGVAKVYDQVLQSVRDASRA